jgi:D-inositol-3-phosphate glycosyltransferase
LASPRLKLLWVGDACSHTGFARVTHSVLEHLHDIFDVTVIGALYEGDPGHGYPYPIYPAQAIPHADIWGLKKTAAKLPDIAPDVVCVINDPWVIELFCDEWKKQKFAVPLCAYMPVDGPNCVSPKTARALNETLSAAVFYTGFGATEARGAGFDGPAHVIPHGIDAELFSPGDQATARAAIGMPSVMRGGFVVLNVNRNQPRKRLDLTIAHFAEWVRTRGVTDAWLHLHCAEKDVGWRVRDLARYYRIHERLILTSPDMTWRRGIPDDQLVNVYRAANVQVTTTLGEGWGLTTMEGMACGIPQIVPEWSALAEWTVGAAWHVRCSAYEAFPGSQNTIGGIIDREGFVAALDQMYESSDVRAEFSESARRHVTAPSFTWKSVAAQFADVLHGAAMKKKAAA